LHLPAAGLSTDKMQAQVNSALSARFAHPAQYVKNFDYPLAWVNSDAFAALKINEQDGERAVGDALKQVGLRAYYTRSQLERSDVPNTETGLKYLHSYSPLGGWHVPLAFYGIPFQPGTYRTHAEPVDLAPTLASLLGINAPTHSVGRVLTEILAPPRRTGNSSNGVPDRNLPNVEGWVDRSAAGQTVASDGKAAKTRNPGRTMAGGTR